MQIKTGIITISDRAAAGSYPDLSGPALKSAALAYGWIILDEAVTPDERGSIQSLIRRQITLGCQLILTTGGTGISPRDVTPEAVRDLGGRELPGFGEVMRRESLKITPHALLSRCLAADLGGVLVLCLPGKPTGAVECLDFVVSAIPHAIELLQTGV